MADYGDKNLAAERLFRGDIPHIASLRDMGWPGCCPSWAALAPAMHGILGTHSTTQAP